MTKVFNNIWLMQMFQILMMLIPNIVLYILTQNSILLFVIGFLVGTMVMTWFNYTMLD